eukprot:CAMPEP_0119319354 /NCGR_PEP_ID=MMETSP1333-20130426/49159_1 /TAXON_ID=418940 /ORGANISM="Scyphosphaera apsteinii, Strain RCC1455" /LENGTH=493 /DNA_ID=CAMNT_0007325739 /DNA_START=352 /DNA_END=1830 /DNA_ORIENTATION=+
MTNDAKSGPSIANPVCPSISSMMWPTPPSPSPASPPPLTPPPGAVPSESNHLINVTNVSGLPTPFLTPPPSIPSPPSFPPCAPPSTPPSLPPSVPPSPPPAYLAAWDEYTSDILARPEGVQEACKPMRFPARAPYRGVAVLFHGFTSCPQEMALLAPPLSNHGFDVIMPLNAGHGNSIRFKRDASGWLYSYLGLAWSTFALLLISVCAGCFTAQSCPPGNCPKACTKGGSCFIFAQGRICGPKWRVRWIILSASLATLLLVFSVVGIIIVWSHGDDVALCLDIGTFKIGCDGHAEYNSNLPRALDGHVDVVDRINGIVAMAPGKHLVAGLSLGGNYATYASTALAVDGSALYDRALIMAPFMGLPGIDLVLGPTNLLGFGEVSLYWGEDCQKERQNGRGGYCSMALSHMKAARDFGRAASKLVAQNMPNNLIVQLVLVQGDGSVDNSAIEKLRKLYAASSVTVDACLIDAVINETSYHSLISTWNNVGVDKYW